MRQKGLHGNPESLNLVTIKCYVEIKLLPLEFVETNLVALYGLVQTATQGNNAKGNTTLLKDRKDDGKLSPKRNENGIDLSARGNEVIIDFSFKKKEVEN